MLKIKIFHCNLFQENAILLWDESKEAAIVDPGFYNEKELSALEKVIGSEGLHPKLIMLTHAHFDHIYSVTAIAAKYGIKVYMDPAEKVVKEWGNAFAASFGMSTPDGSFHTENIEEGMGLSFGECEFKVISTPGHTPGGVCFLCEKEKLLLSGDTLFAGSIGRTDHPGGDYDKEIVSIMDKLMGLDGDIDVIPGHGPTTNIGYERTHNPFLQPFNEPNEGMNRSESDSETDSIT